MREDVLTANQCGELMGHEAALRAAVREKRWDDIDALGGALTECLVKLMPRRAFAGLRENIEVIAVAVAVAMGFRAYFIQPFKIPTGSMQPTLYGITAVDRGPGLTDRMPLKLLQWLVNGEWHRTVKVRAAGTVNLVADANGRPYVSPNYPNDYYYTIAGIRYRIPRGAKLKYQAGEYAPAGETLWAGSRSAGDHVFVDKVRWNFFPPKRGQVMVFSTRGIDALERTLPRDRRGRPMSTHYIKRMCGLPGETIAIAGGKLYRGSELIAEPASIRRIAEREPGYAGFRPLGRDGEHYTLGADQYLALGDNTTNSRDSRYWGPVPRINLVGPACWVYWPFTRPPAPPGSGAPRNRGRWGLIR
jgi:signal peptidase I